VKDPSSGKPFLALYRWQKRKGEWKVTKRFSVRSKKELAGILTTCARLGAQLPE